ncbi:MAG: PEP-CTERM sorting domain-containing protein [Phycisphaerales bacterium]|nr:PEP-CTERM sorting domain-containing protein [Phycisphaerales bacterium]
MKRIVSVVLAAGCGAANADLHIDFEGPLYNGSAAGVVATGQDGWTLPSGVDSHIYTYAGNAPGLALNAFGGEQFLGGTSQGGTSFARAQRAVDFSAGGKFVLSYDFAAIFTGALPSADNLASFSLQDSVTAKSYIALNRWLDNANPSLGWKAEYNVFDAAGAALNNQLAGPEWGRLAINHWYRQTTVVDLATNQILRVAIEDLTTGDVTSVNPTGWFVAGGANSTRPLPTGVRFFMGGNAGNTMGWDNLDIVPAPGTLALVGAGLLGVSRRRRA